MKSLSIKKESILSFFLMGVVCILVFKQCTQADLPVNNPEITIVRDTVWQIKTDTFKVKTTAYKTVYVDTTNIANIVEDTIKEENPETYVKAKVYRDTLSNPDITIYSYNLVEGRLLDSNIIYDLKVPREIMVTKTIKYPKEYRSGLYLFGEMGGKKHQFDNISFGLQYNRKGKWFVSYRVNTNILEQPTHNIGVGLRLFN